MDQLTDLELDRSGLGGFEPQQRARSNTWPLPRPENLMDKDDMELDKDAVLCVNGAPGGDPSGFNTPNVGGAGGAPKKNSSRRNAWGNMSYADLITQAITSSPEKRLTLSQIYDWMVQHVPYFKDKGDSNSSAGWKNSIRHNLSLHNRFMRVQNEGAGKSSWWMINPDARPGKAARRRATSMETQKYEKKRGRIKKKIDGIRNGIQQPDTTPSPSSSVSEGLDMFPDSPVLNNNIANSSGFQQLSPDFRPRASSNASSCASRLSPIPALEQDNQVPPLSPVPWNNDLVSIYGTPQGAPPAYPSDIDNIKLCDSIAEAMTLSDPLPLKPNNTYSSSIMQHFNSGPPRYTELSTARCQQPQVLDGLSPPSCNLVRVKMEPVYNPLSAAVNPPPTIPESLEPKQESLSNSLGCTASQLRGHILASADCVDLNLDTLDTLQGGLECDVDQVIRHELSVDGSLDFNFSDQTAPSVAASHHIQPPTASQGPRPWVH